MTTPDHDSLQQRIAALEAALAEMSARAQAAEVAYAQDYASLLRGPFTIFRWVATEGFPVEYVSPNIAKLSGHHMEEFLEGRIVFSDLVVAEDHERILAELINHSEAGDDEFEQEYRIHHRDGSIRWVYDFTAIIRNDADVITHYYGYILDISERKRIEERQHALQQEIIAAQAANLQELSTPLLPITAHAVVMPLVGTIDTRRAQQVIENLLSGISAHHASIAILDITGVQVVDTQVARVLVHAAQAASLIGTQVLITGMRPEVAQTLVQLGVELHGIKTMNSLRSGVIYAIAQESRK